MSVQSVIAIKPHDIGGASHNPSTLAELNTKVSDATLDDVNDPRDPKAHASTHLPSGSDPITTAAASGLDADSTNGAGTAESLARSDHTHEISEVGTVSTIVPDATATPGTALGFARKDHGHAIVAATAGAIQVGDAAAEGIAPSFARSDHQHSLAAPAAPADVTKAAASAGTSPNVARQDHKHDVTTAAPITAIGTTTANGEGTATTLARSDHSHEVNLGYTQVTSVTPFSTSSITDVLIAGMTVTPGAGTYLALFSGQITGDGGAKLAHYSIYANGVQAAHSERTTRDIVQQQSSTQAVVTVADGQAIEARGRGQDTLYADQRSLVVLRLT